MDQKVKIEGTKVVKLISEHDHRGFEIPDPTPMAVPVDFTRPLTIQEMVRNAVKTQISQAAREEGLESFEDADDFDIGDEPDLRSPYELDDEQESASAKEFENEKPVPPAPPAPPAPSDPPVPPAPPDPTKA